MTESPTVDDLLDRADAARTAGRGDDAARLYDAAISRCRSTDDLVSWTRAVLGAASVYLFGTEPGKLPAQLYDVLVRTTDDADRARVAAALARCWAYAGHITRATRFADEAIERAERTGDPKLLADCLDAALASHWGPDEVAPRVVLAARLDEVAAHVLETETRLQAHLWGLQMACEVLDLQALHRHMRALEQLGEESDRARFFAASRRFMLDLLRGRTDTADHLIMMATVASEQASLADAWMVIESMKGYLAAQTGDTAACAGVAEQCEAFGLAEGNAPICAEAAFLWTCADRTDRAHSLVHTFHGRVLEQLPRDVNWLLTLQCVLEAALAVDDPDVIATAARLLSPYAGRAVINGGAVMFHGVTDDTLSRAAAALGDTVTAERLRRTALSTYERIGASWWRHRLEASAPAQRACSQARVWFSPSADGLWIVGPDSAPSTVRALRGYSYLRELLRQPGQAVSALDLVSEGRGTVLQPGVGEVLDRRAIDAYRHRLAELEQDLVEAQEWGDLGRTGAIASERDALVSELSAAAGFRGRARNVGSTGERARVAATKAIAAAINRIAAVDEQLGRHLRTAVHTGIECSYQPSPGDELDWILDT